MIRNFIARVARIIARLEGEDLTPEQREALTLAQIQHLLEPVGW